MNKFLDQWTRATGDADLNPTSGAVCAALAAAATGLSAVSFTSLRALSRATGVDRMQCQEALEGLREHGFIGSYTSSAYGNSNGYALSLPTLDQQ